jgi:ribosomal protein L20A (L18A)
MTMSTSKDTLTWKRFVEKVYEDLAVKHRMTREQVDVLAVECIEVTCPDEVTMEVFSSDRLDGPRPLAILT